MTNEPKDPKPPDENLSSAPPSERKKIRTAAEVLPFRPPKPKRGNGKADVAEELETTDQLGADGEVTSPIHSEDHLALMFAGCHENDARYVAKWGKWFLWWESAYWREDRVHRIRSLSRNLCRKVAFGIKKRTEKKKIASKATVMAVEYLTQADPKIAAEIDVWDQGELIFNNTPEPESEKQ